MKLTLVLLRPFSSTNNQFRRCIFENINIFCHLKLEIALEIPSVNDEKYNWNNSARQGLKYK